MTAAASTMNPPAADLARGPALLAGAGPPEPADLATMVACAGNLRRALVTTATGSRPGGVLVTAHELGRVVATARRISAAIVVVAGKTSPRLVRRLAAAARCPVLVARTREPWGVVLAASDLRTTGTPVIAAGAALAARGGARVLVVHNIAPGWNRSPARAVPLESAAVLRRLARVAARTSPSSSVEVCRARAVDRAIVDAMVSSGASVVVVGMHRPRPGLRKGCADRVLRRAPGNVVIVPLASSAREAVRS